MRMQDLVKKTPDELNELWNYMASAGNMVGCRAIGIVQKFYGKKVTVIKGRKVPHGTTGTCFWLGCTDHSKYGDPWGIYTSFRCGIKEDDGTVYWTAVDNIELA